MYDNQAKTLEEIKNAKELYIHEGIFHMDDMLCVALIKKINPNIKIIRDRDNIPEDTTGIICDCSGGFFDHHIIEKIRERANGTKMASMGCLMQVIGEEIFEEKWKQIDEEIISILDDSDLGPCNNYLSLIIDDLNPLYKQEESVDSQVNKAIEFCSKLINSLNNEKKQEVDYDYLLNKYFEDKNISDDIQINIFEYFGNNGNQFLKEIQDEKSLLTIYLSGLSQEEQLKELSTILDRRKLAIEVDKIKKIDLEEQITSVIENQKEYETFDCHPGNFSVFTNENIKFVIFPESDTTNYGISVVGEAEKVNNETFSDSKIPFPQKITGKTCLLKKEIELYFPSAKEIINEYLENNQKDLEKNLPELSTKLSNLLNKKINLIEKNQTNSSIEKKLIELKDSIDIETNKKTKLLKLMEKKGLTFVHDYRFYAVAKDKQSAIKFVKEILEDKEYIKQTKIEQLKNHLKTWFETAKKENIPIEYINQYGNRIEVETPRFFIELLDRYNSSIEYITEMSKLIKLCINKESKVNVNDVLVLAETKDSTYEITKEIKNLIKDFRNEEINTNYNLNDIKEIIQADISPESIAIFVKDKEFLKPNEIKTEIELLKIRDKYEDKDFTIPEVRIALEKDLKEINITENIKNSEILKTLEKLIEEPEKTKRRENIIEC